jgi:uncharacterized membrane protein
METLRAFYTVAGVLLALLAIPMVRRRIPPNGLYGFRVPRTIENPDLWYDANEFAGRRLLLCGICTIAAALILSAIPGITLDAYALGCAAVSLGALAVTVVQSCRYLGSLAE